MLGHTFQHIRGITARREQDFWRDGVQSWEAMLRTVGHQPGLFDGDRVETPIERMLLNSASALSSGDVLFFGENLDRKEHYRICLSFPNETLFLDIETTGLSRYYDHITVIGWSMGSEYGFFVKNQSDESFKSVLSRAKAIVTFNGILFDIPFIKHEFPNYTFPGIHVDLRFLAKRVGLSGGQKAIEQELGISRQSDLKGIAGESAPILWTEYTRGDINALRLLLLYNASDIWGMKQIFDEVARRSLTAQGFPLTRLPQPEFKKLESLDREFNIQAAIEGSLLAWKSSEDRKLKFDDLFVTDHSPDLRVVGIDLTGSEKKPSGWCVLSGRNVETDRLSSDAEIIARTVEKFPNIISIDSPLTLPEGRISVDDGDPGRAKYGIMRHSERVLKRRGVNVYPALIPSMQRLTARGIRLAKAFRELGFPVIESYPGAAQDIMGIPRKRKSIEYLENGLAAFGLAGSFTTKSVSHDELDAITSAIVGVFFWVGQVERLGFDPIGEEALMIPDLRISPIAHRSRLVVGLSGSLGAGKTTAAEHLSELGYTYSRYSQVIARLVKQGKPEYSRDDLQMEGDRVHRELGQRWLGRELIRDFFMQTRLVIDGLRFPDDHAFLTEIFGSQFIHLHIVADKELRKVRYEQREGKTFDMAANHIVESKADDLRMFAHGTIENNGSLSAFLNTLEIKLSTNRS